MMTTASQKGLRFPLEAMGVAVVVEGRKIVSLDDFFVVGHSQELNISRGFAKEGRRDTSVCCPLCDGFLRLDTVVHHYGEGCVPLSLIHTKDRHYFHCSNSDCGAAFVAEVVYVRVS